jgi:hypothetical protein
METIQSAIQQISDTAEEIQNDADQRFPEAATPGDCWRQGDLYITLLGAIPGDVKKSKARKQLVHGDTQGSRHCLDSLTGAAIYELSEPSALDGPILECKQERTITHPEHGNVILPPGIYGIHYQRDLDSEERERRVLD